ncbi:hypothetical protein [Flagellimonas pacifica]|uniref:SdiA-regulated family protein n=1 Tax=Flagellimonas pacifica TaxID=1247520 RepID=A0A285MBL5_9FLAO|nr:hypothetical protein [Allomuricauda parva]SNY94582.1 hypothetical protein SAMN06265377_0242 [Allomuricauda parva]
MSKFSAILALVFLQGCAQKPYYGDLTYLGKLPSKLSEVSGIATFDQSRAWVLEDNGNKDIIYAINLEGKLVKEFKVKHAKNNDWEDLAKDKKGNLYIGDFGNNDNDRKNLTIYKLPNPNQEKGSSIPAEKIEFYYPQQKEFPPSKKELLFDAEAFFHWNDHLYIFTKDRSRPYLGKTLVYKVPDKKGTYEARLIGTLNLCNEQHHCSVTGADISKDGKTLALLGYGYLYLIRDFELEHLSFAKISRTYLKHETQMESICFLDDSTLLIADEQSQTKGRNLYSYKLD